MKNIYNGKSFIEEVLLGTNTNGIGFINESAQNHFQKSSAFTGFNSNANYANDIISVGLLNGNILEIGIDSGLTKSQAFCSCLKNDICRKLMINEAYIQIRPKQKYNAHLTLNPGNKVGHVNLAGNSYGSLGFFLLPRNKNENPCIISNNHVLADSNNANVGDAIYSLDGSAVRIGTLDNYVPITNGANRLDLAIAELHGFSNPIPKNSAGYRTPFIGEKVYKRGATTGVTNGIVRSLHYTSKINYGGFNAVFVDQIQITTGIAGHSFSAGGDSGSIIKSRTDNALVGLLFAGNGTWTLANHQTLVVQQLKQWGYPIK
ncbi:MAG: hypothetical protein JNJ41_01990 [Bacteroidia bacterium]|nr:hypothetical protein [Bacteroidia bacterium]